MLSGGESCWRKKPPEINRVSLKGPRIRDLQTETPKIEAKHHRLSEMNLKASKMNRLQRGRNVEPKQNETFTGKADFLAENAN